MIQTLIPFLSNSILRTLFKEAEFPVDIQPHVEASPIEAPIVESPPPKIRRSTRKPAKQLADEKMTQLEQYLQENRIDGSVI